MTVRHSSDDERVLVLMPTTKDGERTRSGLERAGMHVSLCRDFADLANRIAGGGGAALFTEEALVGPNIEVLAKALEQQPAWSDFPLLILARDFSDGRPRETGPRWNVTLLERPLRMRSLLSVLEAALRSRRHQYTVREQMAERERQAEALREKDARLRFVLAAGGLGSWELDADRGEWTVSDICKAIFGRPPEGSLTYAEFWAAIHPEDRHRVREQVERSLAHRVDYDCEYRVVWPDGSIHWLLARGQVSGGAAGEALRMSGVSLDITSRKQAEAKLRDADRRKDEFLAVLAHELRNPLAPLRTGLQIVQMAPDDPETFEEACGVMQRQLDHMVRLIDDLLDISRISQNKMELRKSLVPLSEIFSAAVETVRPLIKSAGHELTVGLPAEPIYLDADLTRLAQVFSNLLSNSAKYTKRSGQIALTAEKWGKEVVISVRDDGIGIPEASLSTIFDMFSQVDRSVERTTGGLGIGLALVKRLVEMHGGTVSAESRGPGTGSIFTIHLQEAEPPAAVKPMAHPRSTRVARKILVVDDNRDAAQTMAMMLRLLGNEVATAFDGLDAIETEKQFQPDVILMDVGMPRLNGYEATRRIRERKSNREVFIVAVTGWGQEGDRENSKNAGCDAHLVKPVDLADLQLLLANLDLEKTESSDNRNPRQ